VRESPPVMAEERSFHKKEDELRGWQGQSDSKWWADILFSPDPSRPVCRPVRGKVIAAQGKVRQDRRPGCRAKKDLLPRLRGREGRGLWGSVRMHPLHARSRHFSSRQGSPFATLKCVENRTYNLDLHVVGGGDGRGVLAGGRF
jgi:hypothetical protein